MKNTGDMRQKEAWFEIADLVFAYRELKYRIFIFLRDTCQSNVKVTILVSLRTQTIPHGPHDSEFQMSQVKKHQGPHLTFFVLVFKEVMTKLRKIPGTVCKPVPQGNADLFKHATDSSSSSMR